MKKAISTKKKVVANNSVQLGFALDVEVKPNIVHEKQSTVKKVVGTYETSTLGLNSNWENFGNYISNKRGNKI